MELLEEIVKLYEYIKSIERENKELKIQLDNVRKSYKELNKEVIELELENLKQNQK